MAARIVYSTGVGTLCPNCRRAVRECVCPKGAAGAARAVGVRVGREGVIEIQGEHRDVVLAELDKHGWQPKKSGG